MIELTILGLAFAQNIAFALVSRARNRNHVGYHATAAVLSNGIWFLTMRELVVADLTLWLFVPYVVGTVLGSLFGADISMRIEKLINARTDS